MLITFKKVNFNSDFYNYLISMGLKTLLRQFLRLVIANKLSFTLTTLVGHALVTGMVVFT